MSDVKAPIDLQGKESLIPPPYEPPQTGYPPSQLGYPPSLPGYPPSQLGYPPSQLGYPPAQPGFQPGNSTSHPGFQTSVNATPYGPYGYSGFQPPPSQYPQSQPFQQQQASNVVVACAQPSAATSTVVNRSIKDHYMTLSLLLTIICGIVFGVQTCLLCTVPAMICALLARRDDAAGNTAAANRKGKIALGLNIFGILFHIVAIIAIVLGLTLSSISSDNEYRRYCKYCSYSSYSYNPCSYSYSYGYSQSYSYTYSSYSCT